MQPQLSHQADQQAQQNLHQQAQRHLHQPQLGLCLLLQHLAVTHQGTQLTWLQQQSPHAVYQQHPLLWVRCGVTAAPDAAPVGLALAPATLPLQTRQLQARQLLLLRLA
jgi:hypothetical protein